MRLSSSLLSISKLAIFKQQNDTFTYFQDFMMRKVISHKRFWEMKPEVHDLKGNNR
jgi:hypothetical protein